MSVQICQDAPPLPALQRVRVVMVQTSLAANIGAAARAMKTMGLVDLVLVAPTCPFPHGDAMALASGAADLLQQTRVVARLEDAIADCELVFGTSARVRGMPWPVQDLRPAATQAMSEALAGHQVAVVFGRENSGLTNDELALCHAHLTIPVNPDYGVLNVAAAIQVVGYELRMQALEHVQKNHQDPAVAWDEPLVDQAHMQQFYQHFEQTLADLDFMDPDNPRLLPRRLRRLFGRIRLDRMEYNLLRGVLSRVQALHQGTWPPPGARLNKPGDAAAVAPPDGTLP